MAIEIKSRWDSSVVVYRSETATTVKEAVEEAVRNGANLDSANLARASLVSASLDGASLDGANLDSANLVSASLDGASLVSASLVSASLVSANLDSANLARASLVSASLVSANLARANLDSANLARANLDSASLDGANLDSANLARANLDSANLVSARGVGDWRATYREDVYRVLDAAPGEVGGLLAALMGGRVDGSVYRGECACLVGTIANVRGVDVERVGIALDGSRSAERWFLPIRKGHTPLNNERAAFASAWIQEWMATHAGAAAP